ncbi:hypothetical protein KEM54_003256 [Ascosphaera aggregata]|nr:hypothetical protein KEM54_003256 [Ascosphaera aggregata]
MTDTPSTTFPTDPIEQPILDRLLVIRDGLYLLKQDKSTYIRSKDAFSFYEQVTEQVKALNDIRGSRVPEHNRVDYVLDDCFQLISLVFLTVGRNLEAPAVYSMASTVKRLLDHLKEARFYSQKDLDSIAKTLLSMRETVERGKNAYALDLVRHLGTRLSSCERILKGLQDDLAVISPELVSTHETLVSILRSTAAANTRSKFNAKEVESFKKQLLSIQATMKDGHFVAADGAIPSGEEITRELLHRCLTWCDHVLERQGKIDERFQTMYDELVDIRNTLDKLSMTQAWSLRETDLYSFQRRLDRFDESRVNGNFLDAQGKPADLHAQRTLLYLIRRGYSLIYSALISSEPVSEALLPIYNQLQTLRKCLIQVKESGGVSNSRELYPYSMKLNSIDSMRVDGKFYVGDDIPEGQGSINDLLAQCYDLCYEIRADADEAAEAAEAAAAAK